MYSLLLIIPPTTDLNRVDELWPQFLKEAEKMPGLSRESVTLIEGPIYGKRNIARIYTFHFPDQAALRSALSSPAGERAGELIHQLTEGKVQILTGKTLEDVPSPPSSRDKA